MYKVHINVYRSRGKKLVSQKLIKRITTTITTGCSYHIPHYTPFYARPEMRMYKYIYIHNGQTTQQLYARGYITNEWPHAYLGF